MDEKSPVGAFKLDGIPVPATTPDLPQPPRRRFRTVARWTFVAVLLSIHLWNFSQLKQWIYSESPQGISDFKPKHREHPLVGKAAEKLFLSIPNEASAIAASRLYATTPHVAGSEGDLLTAKSFLLLLQEQLGITPHSELPIFPAGSKESRQATLRIPKLHSPAAWIDVYYPVMNTPLNRSLQVLGDDGKAIWEADLAEHTDEADPEAHQYADAVPTFHGLSSAGDVTGKIVYANYGRKEDYDDLVDKGVNFTNTIVLVRYGGIFRGLKIKRAEELGAAGVLIYSDLRDDGTVTAENGYAAYPHGPARNPTSVQRGSVQYLSLYPGDPTTPGYPAYENSTRTAGLNIPSIPSLPISWQNAEALLKTLEGGEWENKTVRLANDVDTKVTPIWNTMGVIPGHIKDEIVVIGNHRDAWVMGATDPSSGTASVHEVIRGLGELTKKGWKPLRTILIASWDAEEYGLIGSTEWGEDFADWIEQHVVGYLNLDSSVSGSRFSISASPSLAHLSRAAAEEIPHPTDAGRTLWDATKDTGKLFGAREDGLVIMDEESAAVHMESNAVKSGLGVGTLGSGSDFTVFLQRIGVASGQGGFGSTLHDPVYHYHSVYDSEKWQETYGDPGFVRHTAVAKHLGLVTLRLASEVILPFNTTHYSGELQNYLDKVEEIAAAQSLQLDLSTLRKSIGSLQAASLSLDYQKFKAEKDLQDILKKWHKRQSKLKKKLRKAYCHIKKVFGKKCKSLHAKSQCHGKDESASIPAIARDGGGHSRPRVGRYPAWAKEQKKQAQLELAYALALQAGFDIPMDAPSGDTDSFPEFPLRKLMRVLNLIREVNKKLAGFERGFISEDGIKDREWYRHLGVAPGKWLGYGATTFPALTEALTFEKNTTLAACEAERLSKLIDNLAENIRVHA